jgi:predicted GNAT family acetyltransferase
MSEVQNSIGNTGSGVFFIEENGTRMAYMNIHINGSILQALHTEVDEAWKGHGLGHRLVEAMVEYARKNKLKVVAQCPFVRAQFERHPEQYADVWQKTV